MHLEYLNQDIWSLLVDINNECGYIKWTNTCKDKNNNTSYSIMETNTQIVLNLNFCLRLTVVSPNPLYY